jgi:cardiolipin synthase
LKFTVRNAARSAVLTLTITLAVTLTTLSGCAPLSAVPGAGESEHVPAPVTDHGMTLVWGHDVKNTALKMIQSSRSFCYADIYELSDPDILDALIEARRRGVDVRVVVDATEHHSQDVAVPELRQAGVPVASLRIHHGISHIKMLLTDGDSGGVLIGGMNFGEGSWDNNDGSVYLPNPNPSFRAVFNWDWRRAHGEPAAEPSVQEPLLNERLTQRHVVDAIQSATTSVRMEAFNLSDWDVLDALEAACRRGVAVEVLLDPHQTQNSRAATRLRRAGATVRFYKPYGNEWMHAKILDVDNGRIFIIGSANFSHQAYTYNHEGDVELHGFTAFDKALEENLSTQLSRGTDYPERSSHTTSDSSD